MPDDPHDLIRLAELIKLAAASARVFAELATNGFAGKIHDAADRIDAAADELVEAGRNLGAKARS